MPSKKKITAIGHPSIQNLRSRSPHKTKGNASRLRKLSNKRRDKLIALQQKEQLKSLLVSKFVEKYGKVKGNKEFIAREVNSLL